MFKREIVNVSKCSKSRKQSLYFVFFTYVCVTYFIKCIQLFPNIMKSRTLLQHLILLLTWMQTVMSIRSEEFAEAFSKQRRLSSHLTITVSCLTISSSTVLQAELIHLIQSIPRNKEQTISYNNNFDLVTVYALSFTYFYFLIHWRCEKYEMSLLRREQFMHKQKKALFKGQLT